MHLLPRLWSPCSWYSTVCGWGGGGGRRDGPWAADSTLCRGSLDISLMPPPPPPPRIFLWAKNTSVEIPAAGVHRSVKAEMDAMHQGLWVFYVP